MPSLKDDLKERLTRYRQINLSVICRKSEETIWFRSSLFWKATHCTCYPFEAQTHSGCPQEPVDSD
jgi:hypothetical protein